MDMKNFSIATLAALLLSSACLINADDDDASTTNSSNSNTSPTTDPTDATTTVDPPAESSSSAETTVDTSADTSTGTPINCGWGELAEEDDFDFGYKCEGEGEDPDGMVAYACPADLTEGGDCEEAGITGQGCCDADGNAWFCQDPDGDTGKMEPRVVMDDCND
jgi:hypothetical protein